ncbi:hydroxymethylglutaryl-CoA lyase, mitochondrial [Prorops nasuta]|uniref:hydroxymethylglutaryl-CoA lyase, mitochondrial n=1 Tax=Prorops nasuta TaxID=863751 RepID=UPI0034CFDBEA
MKHFSRISNLSKVFNNNGIMYRRNQSNFVQIVEVGPRDGLQNEPNIVPSATKINLINRLSRTGLKRIEVTSFVSSKWIPQLADNIEVYNSIEKKPDIRYSALVPNIKGLEKALKADVKEIAIFGAASETFTLKNINCSIAESIERFSAVLKEAKQHNLKIRGYISCIAGCPYEGKTKPSTVANLAASMLNLGCYEISLGDTIGVGTPKIIKQVLNELKYVSQMSNFALHCHDTYGQALVNIYEGLENDIRIFDSSVAGLGGCPYAKGASGNISTETLLYLLHNEGLETGVDLDEMIRIGHYISAELKRPNQSKVGLALKKS